MTEAVDIERLKEEARSANLLSRMLFAITSSGLFKLTDLAVEIEDEMKEIFRPVANISGRHGEDRSCAIFDYGINAGIFDSRLHPDVVSSKKEHRVRAGRIDRLLEHADGSLTVVEIKPSGSLRDQAHGLGQSIMYASSLRAELQDNRNIMPALFVSADYDPEIAFACESVGVAYLYFPRKAQILVDELDEIHRAR